MAVFFEEPGEFFFGSEFILTVVNMHVDVDQHTYTHTSMRQHQLLKFTHCQSMRFVICDSPIKVAAKG